MIDKFKILFKKLQWKKIKEKLHQQEKNNQINQFMM